MDACVLDAQSRFRDRHASKTCQINGRQPTIQQGFTGIFRIKHVPNADDRLALLVAPQLVEPHVIDVRVDAVIAAWGQGPTTISISIELTVFHGLTGSWFERSLLSTHSFLPFIIVDNSVCTFSTTFSIGIRCPLRSHFTASKRVCG